MKAKINKDGDLILIAENDAEYAIINNGDFDLYLEREIELPTEGSLWYGHECDQLLLDDMPDIALGYGVKS